MNDSTRRVDTAIRGAVRQRNYRRVRDRALARLKKEHPEDYARLFEEERIRDEAEGRSWRSIRGRDGDSPSPAGYSLPTSTRDQTKQARHNGAAEGELG